MDRIDTCLMALRRILRATELYGKEVAQTVGVTPVQLRVMQIVAETGSSTGSVIARRMHVSQATITSLLDKLSRAEMIERVPDDADRRRTIIRLTPKGDAALAKVPDALQQRFVTAFLGLEDWEQAMLVANLERVAAMMDATAIDSSAVLTTGDL